MKITYNLRNRVVEGAVKWYEVKIPKLQIKHDSLINKLCKKHIKLSPSTRSRYISFGKIMYCVYHYLLKYQSSNNLAIVFYNKVIQYNNLFEMDIYHLDFSEDLNNMNKEIVNLYNLRQEPANEYKEPETTPEPEDNYYDETYFNDDTYFHNNDFDEEDFDDYNDY